MSITTVSVKEYARSIGADLVGIADIHRYAGSIPGQDPRYILPTAKCVIGAAFRVPRGIMATYQAQPYAYTALGVKALDEERSTIFLLKMARLIENAGYEACIQRTCPNLMLPGNEGTNPEVKYAVNLKSMSVDGVKPAPDVLIDFQQSAVFCGMAVMGRYGKALTPEFGPYQRFTYIVTNAPLEADPLLDFNPCQGCEECLNACPGHAVKPEGGVDTWQCSVYYRGAGQPDMLPADYPERETILKGKKHFGREDAQAVYPVLDKYPMTHYGYVPCLCGKACDAACDHHLKTWKEAHRHENS